MDDVFYNNDNKLHIEFEMEPWRKAFRIWINMTKKFKQVTTPSQKA